MCGESALARLGDLLGARAGRRPAGWGTLDILHSQLTLSFANLGLTYHVLFVLGIIFVVLLASAREVWRKNQEDDAWVFAIWAWRFLGELKL